MVGIPQSSWYHLHAVTSDSAYKPFLNSTQLLEKIIIPGLFFDGSDM